MKQTTSDLAVNIMDQLIELRHAVVKMHADNNFSMDERIDFLNKGTALIPEMINYIEVSVQEIGTLKFLLNDAQDHINNLTAEKKEENTK